jgi:enoyl-CoA hydratase/carnithine racemase
VAADNATFAFPEVDLGVPMTWDGVPRLIAEIGAAHAREIVLLCDAIDAVEAHRIELVHRLPPTTLLEAVVDDLARVWQSSPSTRCMSAKLNSALTRTWSAIQHSATAVASNSPGDSATRGRPAPESANHRRRALVRCTIASRKSYSSLPQHVSRSWGARS